MGCPIVQWACDVGNADGELKSVAQTEEVSRTRWRPGRQRSGPLIFDLGVDVPALSALPCDLGKELPTAARLAVCMDPRASTLVLADLQRIAARSQCRSFEVPRAVALCEEVSEG